MPRARAIAPFKKGICPLIAPLPLDLEVAEVEAGLLEWSSAGRYWS